MTTITDVDLTKLEVGDGVILYNGEAKIIDKLFDRRLYPKDTIHLLIDGVLVVYYIDGKLWLYPNTKNELDIVGIVKAKDICRYVEPTPKKDTSNSLINTITIICDSEDLFDSTKVKLIKEILKEAK